jgi:hypothetical protein
MFESHLQLAFWQSHTLALRQDAAGAGFLEYIEGKLVSPSGFEPETY